MVSLMVGLLLWSSSCAGGKPAALFETATPEQVVREFVAAFLQNDAAGAARLIKGGWVTKMLGDAMRESPGQRRKVTLSDFQTSIKCANATVSCRWTLGGPLPQPGDDTAGPMSGNDKLSLVLSKGRWQIVAPMEPPRSAALQQLAGNFTGIDVAAWDRKSEQDGGCLLNARYLAAGIVMYATDTGGVLRFQVSTWKAAILPYVQNESYFTSPGDTKGRLSYGYNPWTVGHSIQDVVKAKGGMIVLVYEGSKGQLHFDSDGRAAVAFGGGHGERVSRQDAKRLIWKL